MSKTTYNSKLRTRGGRDGASAAVVPALLKCSGDPTAAGATAMTMGDGRPAVLPKGAIVLSVSSLGGASGGTNPTVDVGDGTDHDGFANELDADGVSLRAATGALIGTELGADTTLYLMVGASAATGGTTTVLVEYLAADDGAG